MVKEKRDPQAASLGDMAERHRKVSKLDSVSTRLQAKPAVPRLTKHHSYFEFMENKDKRKKLEYQMTTEKTPPPGFEFVPIGNPQLTRACKEISRERDAMIFIVSTAKNFDETNLGQQVHRIGHHIRETIVEEAKASISDLPCSETSPPNGQPELIPESQSDYHKQVDAAIRDLFPRIPNPDRQTIIDNSFTRGRGRPDEKSVGLSADITLARRVQLAVLAHIRHVHTRYDDLLKETTWHNARKVVESLCLDTLVKWRGDDETGRDQLDEILREVVVISDSDSEEDLSSESSDDASSDEIVLVGSRQRISGPIHSSDTIKEPGFQTIGHHQSNAQTDLVGRLPPHAASKQTRRGFKRYQAWNDAIQRNRRQNEFPNTAVAAGYSDQFQSVGISATRAPQEPWIQDRHYFVTASAGTRSAPNSELGRPSNSHGYATERFQEIPAGPSLGYPVVPGTGTRAPSPPIRQFQDMLVKSIEIDHSASMLPKFVRTIAPRHVELCNVNGDARNECHQGFASTMHNSANDTREVPSHHHHSDSGQSSQIGGAHIRATIAQDVHFAHHESTSFNPRPLVQFQGRMGHHFSHSPELPPAKRIIVDAARPGEPLTQVIMEDRGGFYEKVIVPRQVLHQPSARPIISPANLERSLSGSGYGRRVISSPEAQLLTRNPQGVVGAEFMHGIRYEAPLEPVSVSGYTRDIFHPVHAPPHVQNYQYEPDSMIHQQPLAVPGSTAGRPIFYKIERQDRSQHIQQSTAEYRPPIDGSSLNRPF